MGPPHSGLMLDGNSCASVRIKTQYTDLPFPSIHGWAVPIFLVCAILSSLISSKFSVTVWLGSSSAVFDGRSSSDGLKFFVCPAARFINPVPRKHKNMPESSRIAKRVLLIGWDAADWKLIDKYMAEGAMPFMQQFLERGSRGNLATLKPVLSPMLWNSIGTGKRPY